MARKSIQRPQRSWASKPIDAYIAALSDPSPRVRCQAAAALELLRDRMATRPLLDTMRDPSAEVRAIVVRALGGLGDKRAVRQLLAALGDESPDVCAAAMRALARLHALDKIRSPKATAALIEALIGSRLVRDDAARALGHIGDSRAVQPLTDVLIDEVTTYPSPLHMGDVCAVALGQLGEPAIPALLDLLSRPHSELRRLGTVGLLYAIDARAIEPLRLAMHDQDPMVRQCAGMALAQQCALRT